MSTVMRPRGPLSPRVYWTRRLLLVAVLVLAAALLWWAMPGVGGSGSASAGPSTPATSPSTTGDDPAATDHTTQGQSTAGQPTQGQPTQSHPTQGQPTQSHATQGHSTQGHATHQHKRLPAPTGPCDPTEVTVAVVAGNAPAGDGTTVVLRMSTDQGSPCTLGITPSLLDTRITSGDVVVWKSSSCPDALPARNVVVRSKPKAVYSYTWDGQLNPDSCSATNQIADPGYYWAEAALIGGEPAKTQFEITAG